MHFIKFITMRTQNLHAAKFKVISKTHLLLEHNSDL